MLCIVDHLLSDLTVVDYSVFDAVFALHYPLFYFFASPR